MLNYTCRNVYGSKIDGSIPKEFGRLTKLVSLGLYQNNIVGPIPKSHGNLKSLRFMRLNIDKLSNTIQIEVIDLVRVCSLQVRICSDHHNTRSKDLKL
ncbi:hypothetical protein CDL15_Pgr009893 [Punica granatum]|uniref:Uncharacterized protein n=1 Tax=Punica granatum TaxID=22663 RepID=A0A218WTQ8_PUNGR|nr:hypothetical protein CDL15_Pgr009893 [Punica granatum]